MLVPVHQECSRRHPFGLGPPVPDPDKIICIGLNYADHASEAGLAQTEVPVFFAKFRNGLIGPTSPVLLPRVSSQIDYEGELAVIMGTRCKEVSRPGGP